jgi:hypothetical protein
MNIKEKADSVGTVTSPPAPVKTGLSDAVRIPLLILGDALIFLIFATIGRRSHNEAAGLNSLVQVMLTALPFAAAWFLVSPFVGAFRRGLEVRPRAMVQHTLLAWIAAWPVAMILRGLFVDHAIPPWTFALITLISNTILLLAWRWPLSLIVSMTKRRSR